MESCSTLPFAEKLRRVILKFSCFFVCQQDGSNQCKHLSSGFVHFSFVLEAFFITTFFQSWSLSATQNEVKCREMLWTGRWGLKQHELT